MVKNSSRSRKPGAPVHAATYVCEDEYKIIAQEAKKLRLSVAGYVRHALRFATLRHDQFTDFVEEWREARLDSILGDGP